MWTARGSTSDTDDLSSTTVLKPTFSVPDDIDETGGADKDYEYTVTMMAGGVEQASAYITVTVLEKPNIGCTRWNSSFNSLDGSLSPGGTFRFNTCLGEFGGAPSGSEYVFTWSGVSTECCTPEIALAHLSRTDIEDPVFTAPTASPYDGYLFFTYTLTVSAENADPITISPIGASVETQQRPQLSITCSDDSYEVDAGDPDFDLDCEAAGAWRSSFEYTWQWSPTDNLTGHDSDTPTFNVPGSVDSDTTYTYTVSVSAQNHLSADETVEVTVRDTNPSITCSDAEVYEATADFTLDCSVTNEPSGATYSWAVRGSTANTDDLSSTAILKPTFDVPNNVDADTDYEYTVTLSAAGIDNVTGEVTVTVLNKPAITVTCEEPDDVDEGASIGLECEASGAPTGSTYTWSWSPTTNLTNHNTATPTFAVPDDVDRDTTYTYTVTATADNAEDGAAEVTVTVKDVPVPVVTCVGTDPTEGADDFELNCDVQNAPSGATYAWTVRGSTPDTALDLLSGTTVLRPTFDVPDNVDSDTDYEYTVTLSASGIDDVTEDVTVTVKNKPDITVTCEDSPYEVDEGDTDIALECDASGGPAGSTYTWSWSPTTNLTNHNTATPTFAAPDDVDRDTTYTYTVTAAADNAEDGAAEVTVTVKNTDLVELAVTCSDPDPVYEATAAITLYCRASGAPAGSTYNYAWTARGATAGTDLLSATNIASPVFEVPADIPGGDDDDYKEIYEYTLTVSASGAQNATANVSIKVKEKPNIRAICVGNITYEYFAGTQGQWPADPQCDWEGAPGRNPTYHFKWTTRDGRIDIYSPFIHTPEAALGLLASTIIEAPIFYVPNVVAEKQTYLYSVTVSAENADDVRTQVNVVVRPRNRDDPVSLTIYCRGATRTSLTSFRYDAYDTGPDVLLDCEATGAPEDSTEYTYSWTGNASDRARLSARNIAAPTFEVTEISVARETYDYTLSASATDAQTATASVSVRVRKENLALDCSKTEYEVFEGDDHFSLDDCEPTGIFNLSDVEYEWAARGSTSDTSLLEGDDTLDPTFFVPGDVPVTTDYKYTLTASAPELTDASKNITVKVKQRELTVTCGDQRLYARYQGTEDFTLDCSASGAAKGASYAYKWTPRDDTPDTSLLSSDAVRDPTFFVPDDVPATTNYEYVLTASSPGATDGTVNVRVRVLDASIRLSCTKRYVKYEKDNRFMLDDCTESGAPPGSAYNYAWTPRGDTPDTDLLTRPDEEQPYFELPNVSIREDTDYEYTLTVSARGADPATADVMVRVKNRGVLLRVDCEPDYSVDAGDDDFSFACTASGSEGAAYKYEWTPRIGTSNTALLSATDILSPTFKVPEEVSATHIYRYTLTVSVPVSDQEAKPVTANVLVLVNKKRPLNVTCASVDPVYEGEDDFDLECVASGAPFGSTYSYEWSARGGTPNTGKLSSTTIAKPTFAVPEEVARNETYRYTLTVTAGSAAPGKEEVTVRVLNKRALALVCTQRHEVFEGSEDFSFDCSASGAPAGSSYSYSWTARGSTSDTDLLISGTDGPSPTFDVPEEVDAEETYEYLLTASAENAEDATAEVTVTVLNRGALNVVCASPPLVYEGSEDFPLDCSASGALGDTPDYAWTPRGSTPNTALLVAGTDGPTPTFAVPDNIDADTDYEYLLTVTAPNGGSASAKVTVRVLNARALAVACASPPLVYEGEEDFALDCTASGAPSGSDYAYEWTARGTTADTALLIAGADGPTPTFAVPGEVDGTTTYEYLLTASAEHAEAATAEVTVTVLDRDALVLVCTENHEVYEGSGDFAFDCSVSGVSSDTDLAYSWTAVGNASDTDLLTDVNSLTPTFGVPEDVAGTTTYEYRLTVSAENAESARAEVTVTVLNSGALRVACANPGSVYEGSVDIRFDCSASGTPSGSDYSYAWTARGSTSDTALLIAGTDGPTPTFAVPDEVDETTTYEYLLTVSAENAEDGTAEVTVTVLNSGALSVTCADPGSVYEGSVDITFDCSASGASVGSDYNYAWTARGSTSDTALLITGTDGPTPTFAVPDEVDETTTYEYLLTVSAENAEDGTAEVTVTVLNSGALRVACANPGSVYEGAANLTFDCSASGAPAGSEYAYVWTARGSTANTALLIAGTDAPTPTFAVPDALDETTTYEYLLTVSVDNAGSAAAEVTVTVLNRGALSVTCEAPDSVYEGAADFDLDCSALGAPAGSEYAYVWTAQGSTANTDLLIAGTDGPTPTFAVPDEVEGDETYEYLLTVSAENAEDGTAQVTVTVLNRDALAVVCTDPDSVYEGLEDFALDCSASGAPAGSEYAYAWTARGSTANTALLIAGTDGPTPTFAVPDEVDVTTTYEYLLTVSAENAKDGAAEVTVTVLNRGVLAVACTNPDSVYEGSEDFALDCSASGAPAGSAYDYVWTARGDTQDTSLLSAVGIASPVFLVPDEVAAMTTYEYLLTASAANAEDATAEVAVTVLDRAVSPPSDPVSPPSDPVSPPLASSSAREPSTPSALGVTVSASPLRFGVQSADTEVSLDPMTDQLSTHISGPYHAGRMTLSPGGGEALDENGEMDLFIELASPVMLRRKGGVEDALIVLSPQWSFAESCEQLSSQAIGGLYTEVTLSEADCRLLYFGGELDLTDAPSGRYAGSMDVILRSGEREETHSVEVDVTVIPAQRVITIGPGGVRFSTSRELPAGLTEEQNLSIYPDVAFMTEEKPHGMFELSNPSLVPLEVTVSARFGYTEATENGREVVVEEASESHLGDLSQVVDIHPGVLVLMPGEKGLVRYGIEAGALTAMAERGYAAFFDVVSLPRQYVRTDQMPEEVAGDRTARVTMRVPGVYVPGEAASQLRATLVSISYVGSLSATFLVETQDRPFVGEVLAYDGEGRELGRRETLVYTRSRVRIPLDRIPEGGAVFLRFAPRGSDRVPLPVSVPWDAPRRDIGGIGDKEKTPTSASIAGKP